MSGYEIGFDNYLKLSYTQFALAVIVLYGMPCLSIALALLSPICCCLEKCQNEETCCCRNFHLNLMGAINYLFTFMKKERDVKEKGDVRFKVVGFIAPTGYAYFLLYALILLLVHTSFALFQGTMEFDRPLNISSRNACIEMFPQYNKTGCLLYQNLLTITAVRGIEAACVSFTLSAFVFALLSVLLLKLSGGKRPDEKLYCANLLYSCRRLIIVPFQGFLLIVPRLAYSVYYTMQLGGYFLTVLCEPKNLLVKGQDADDKWKLYLPVKGIDQETFFIMAAICDSLALAMLTPWYLFHRVDRKKGSYDMNGGDPHQEQLHGQPVEAINMVALHPSQNVASGGGTLLRIAHH